MNKLRIASSALVIASTLSIGSLTIPTATATPAAGSISASQISPSAEVMPMKGPTARSRAFDSFIGCMAGKSAFSNLGFGVSLFCHKEGNSWYFTYWRL